jgi:transcriptional regulator with XRE-family HTH domain
MTGPWGGLTVLFKDKLRQLREAVGLTEAELARHSGVPYGTLHNYVLGNRKPSLANAVRLARALDVDCTAFADCDDIAPAKPQGKGKSKRGRG